MRWSHSCVDYHLTALQRDATAVTSHRPSLTPQSRNETGTQVNGSTSTVHQLVDSVTAANTNPPSFERELLTSVRRFTRSD